MLTGLLIVQHLLPEEEQVKLAKAILKAQDYYEDCFTTITSIDGFTQLVNTITNSDAARFACDGLELDEFWISIISNWNFGMWNDVQDWASRVIEAYDTTKQTKINSIW